MFRKPHGYIILMIAALAGAFSYAYVKSPKKSQKIELSLKQLKSSDASFVSVSQHQDKTSFSLSHRSDHPGKKHGTETTEKADLKSDVTESVDSPRKKESQKTEQLSNDLSPSSEKINSLPENVSSPDIEPAQEVSAPSLETQDSAAPSLKATSSRKKENFLAKIQEKKPSQEDLSSVNDSSDSATEGKNIAEPDATVSKAEDHPQIHEAKSATEPEIFLVVEGLGRRQETMELALDLPEGVTLAFHSFEGVENISSRVRSDGHETVLMLPMEPLNYPENDPGPTALLTGLEASENVNRLKMHLSNLPSCVGVIPFLGSRFLVSKVDLPPVFRALKDKGLFFVETFQTSKSIAHKTATRENLSFHRIENRIDQTLTPEAVLKELAILEEEAINEGRAFAVTRDVPMVLLQIASWAKTLPDKKIRLSPLSDCFSGKNESS